MYFAGVLYCLICTTDGDGSHFTNRFMYQGRGHIFDGMASEFRVRTALTQEYDEYPFPGRYDYRVNRPGKPVGKLFLGYEIIIYNLRISMYKNRREGCY